MRILLVNPPAEYTIAGNNPEIIDEERGCNPPLGILFLAACLEESGRHEVEVLDCQASHVGHDSLAAEVRAGNPELVGLTAMTLTLVDVVEAAGRIKEAVEGVEVVVGGPHAAVYPEETAKLEHVDYVIQGEAEYSLLQLADILDKENRGGRKKKGRKKVFPDDLAEVPGLYVWRNGKIYKGKEPAFIENLDEIPFPARHLVPVQDYNSLLAVRGPVTTMFTSRGCPFRCTFCHRPAMGKKFRAVSAHRVVEEMQACKDLGIKEILVYDDTFTVQGERVVAVCEEILRRKLKIVWDVRAHINTVDKDLLKLMRKAGCARIHYGIEAGTDRVLRVLKKSISLDRAVRVVRETRRVGISTLAYFMIGNPTETREEALETIRFAKSLDADYVHITILTPFPGTPLYLDGLREKVFSRDHWKEFARNPTKDFVPPFWEENMTTQELQNLIKKAYQGFYLRPGYILKRLTELRSFDELKRKARAAWKVIRM